MSQHGFTTFAASQRNDGDLPAILEALQSGHIGTVRPDYVVDGMTWHLHRPNEGAAGMIERWFTYGGQDIFEGAFDLDDGTYSGAGGGGDRVAIVSADMTGLAAFEFTAFDPALYAGYLVECDGLTTPNSLGLSAQAGFSTDAGATYNTDHYEFVGTQFDSGDDELNVKSHAVTAGPGSGAFIYASDPGGAASARLWFHPQTAGGQFLFDCQARLKRSGSAQRLLRFDVAGVYETTNPVNAFRLPFASALSGGRITVFGYKKGADLV